MNFLRSFFLMIVLSGVALTAHAYDGSEVYIRIFKAEKMLEIWTKDNDSERFRFYKRFPICHFSGKLGPKTKRGDNQAPEGFYKVYKGSLNPKSRLYLSFNLGYPNEYDRYHGYTGDYLMVHGKCVSKGCFAMTDRLMYQIYDIVESALNNGQTYINVHIFPFHMTDKNMKKYQENKWFPFWQNLRPAYTDFENTRILPSVNIVDGMYIIE